MSNLSILISGFHSRSRVYLAVAILLGSIGAGYTAYWLCTLIGTAEMRSTISNPDSGLMWLRKEFNLTEAQFQRIKSLHGAYAAKCDVMCEQIMRANAALDAAISGNKQVTPEVQQAIAEASRVQQECQRAMFAHIYAVSAQMDQSSSEKYLRMMKQKIIQPGLSSATAVSR